MILMILVDLLVSPIINEILFGLEIFNGLFELQEREFYFVSIRAKN